MIKIFLATLVVLLTSCVAPVKTVSSPPNIKLWKQQQHQVQSIVRWDIRGRVAIQNGDNGGQVDLFWQQTDHQHYDIKLVAPFGAGTIYLQGRASSVLLTTSDGQSAMAETADQLLEQQGWHFPVSGLRYWLLGIPAPTSEAQLISWNTQGLLYEMHQDGWRIELRQYKTVADKTLPRKLFISRLDDEELDMRLVIREWIFDHD